MKIAKRLPMNRIVWNLLVRHDLVSNYADIENVEGGEETYITDPSGCLSLIKRSKVSAFGSASDDYDFEVDIKISNFKDEEWAKVVKIQLTRRFAEYINVKLNVAII